MHILDVMSQSGNPSPRRFVSHFMGPLPTPLLKCEVTNGCRDVCESDIYITKETVNKCFKFSPKFSLLLLNIKFSAVFYRTKLFYVQKGLKF